MPENYSHKPPAAFRLFNRRVAMAVILTGIGLTLIGSLPNKAAAYVLEGPHLLELMVRALGEVKSLTVIQNVFNRSGVGNFTPEGIENLHYRFPASIRSEVKTADSYRIEVKHRNEAATVIDGAINPKLDDPPIKHLDRYLDLLLLRRRALLTHRLITLGIDTAVSSLGREGQKISFVLGAAYPDRSRPQIWIERETFRPFRWIVPADDTDAESADLEFRFNRWQQFAKRWYPTEIQIRADGDVVRRIEVTSVRVDPDFADGFFDPGRIRTEYGTSQNPN